MIRFRWRSDRRRPVSGSGSRNLRRVALGWSGGGAMVCVYPLRDPRTCSRRVALADARSTHRYDSTLF